MLFRVEACVCRLPEHDAPDRMPMDMASFGTSILRANNHASFMTPLLNRQLLSDTCMPIAALAR